MMDVEEMSKKETVVAALVVDCRTEGRRRNLNGEKMAFSPQARRHDLTPTPTIQMMSLNPVSRPIENLHPRLPPLHIRLRMWILLMDDLSRSAL